MTAKKSGNKKLPIKPATTAEGRENQVVSLAYDLAEQQLREGTASAQVISHFLKRGSQKERLEEEKLIQENYLLQAKIDAMASAQRVEEVYVAALNAMREYAGQDVIEFDDEN